MDDPESRTALMLAQVQPENRAMRHLHSGVPTRSAATGYVCSRTLQVGLCPNNSEQVQILSGAP